MMAAGGDPRLRLKLFGPFEALVRGEPLPRLRSRKGQELLALLALNCGRDLLREWLADTLWPDTLPEASLASLRVTLADLASALGEGAECFLRRERKTLALRTEEVWTDLADFRSALQTGEPAGLRSAVDLYTGPLLQGWDQVWLLPDRDETAGQYAAALEALSDHAAQDGDLSGAIAFLQKCALAHPLHQPAHRKLMKLLASSGDFTGAEQVYRQLKETLYERYRAEPDPDTIRVQRQIRDRRRRASNALDFASGAAASEGSGGSPTARSLYRAPRPLTRLIGRDADLSMIESQFAAGRLVTLTGPGGVGKTRLALEVAHRCAEDYAQGAWFVDLSGTSDPGLLPAALAAALEIPDAPGLPGSHDALEAIRKAIISREILVVLDNVEHVAEPLASFLSPLLALAPRLHVLATGRRRLGIGGERVVRVAPLGIPDDGASLDAARQSAAVQLFLDRSGALCPAFTLTAGNLGGVIEICRYLEGLPLALELAAPLLEALSPSEIADRLKHRTSLPPDVDPSRPPRHRTLRAVMDWSYDLLTDVERTLLRRLSIFHGGWTLEDAETVCADTWSRAETLHASSSHQGVDLDRDSVLPTLSRLISRSLAAAIPLEHRTRYSMLRTVQLYAFEKLAEDGELPALRMRHRRRFLALAEQASRGLAGPTQPECLARLDADLENFRSALGEAFRNDTGPDSGLPISGGTTRASEPVERALIAEDGLRLAAALGRYWQIRGFFEEGRRWLELALSGSTEEGDARVDALAWAGALALYQGEFAAAREHAEQALEIAAARSDQWRMAGALGCLGVIRKDQGDLAAAESLFRGSLECARTCGDIVAEASALGYLGILAGSQTRLAEAREYYEAALALRRAQGDRWGIAASLNNLGLLARQEGDDRTARTLLEESLEIRRRLNDRRCIAITLNQLGSLFLSSGDTRPARESFLESVQLSQQTGDRRSLAYSLEAFAALALTEREWERAAFLFGAAAGLREQVGAPLPPSELPNHAARVEQARSGCGPRFEIAWNKGREFSRQDLPASDLTRLLSARC